VTVRDTLARVQSAVVDRDLWSILLTLVLLPAAGAVVALHGNGGVAGAAEAASDTPPSRAAPREAGQPCDPRSRRGVLQNRSRLAAGEHTPRRSDVRSHRRPHGPESRGRRMPGVRRCARVIPDSGARQVTPSTARAVVHLVVPRVREPLDRPAPRASAESGLGAGRSTVVIRGGPGWHPGAWTAAVVW
jgi:hypothetical protein